MGARGFTVPGDDAMPLAFAARSVALLAAACALSACEVQYAFSETVVAPDRTVRQTIVYSQGLLAGTDDREWTGWSAATPVLLEQHPTGFPAFEKLAPCEEKDSKFRMLRRDGVEGASSSRLVERAGKRTISFSEVVNRESRGLVQKITWTGTLSDPVEFDVMAASATALGELLGSVVEDAAKRAAAEADIEGEAYGAWLRSTLREWVRDSIAAYYEHRACGGNPSSHEWVERLARSHGVAVSSDFGHVTFARLTTPPFSLVSRAGRSVSEDEVRGFVSTRLGIPASSSADKWVEALFASEALNTAFEARFQPKDEAERAMNSCFEHLHMAGLWGSSLDIWHRVTLPGALIASNGERIAERTVQWRLDGNDAYPRERVLHATALWIDPRPRGISLVDESLETMQTFVACYERDPVIASWFSNPSEPIRLARIRDYVADLEDQNLNQDRWSNGMKLLSVIR